MRGRTAGVAVLVAALALSVAGCGGRSVAAYCDTFYGDGQEFRQRFIDADAETDPLGTLGLLLAAPRDLAVFFGKLADVAPDDIRPDVETVRGTFQAQADGLGDQAGAILDGPLAGLGSMVGGVAAGLAAGPALQRVDTWTTTNCDPPPAG